MALRRTLIAALVLVVGLAAQTANPPSPRTQIPGNIVSTNSVAGQITIKTDKGETVTVGAGPQTVMIRVPAGENDVKKGTKIAFSALQPGDRVVAFVRQGEPLQATSLVVRTQADLAEMHSKQQADWKARGSAGTVSAVDASTQTITAQSGSHTLAIHTTDKTQFRRYAPDSAKPANARPGTLADVRAGDQVQVLGTKGDGGSIQAEIIYSGAFRQLAVTIDSIDAANGEIKVTDLATKKPLSIRITPDSQLKRMPPEMAQALARRYQSGRQGAPSRTESGPAMDRLPGLTVAELKPKDAIMVSTTSGSEPGHVTAIMLLAGVEPLLTASPNAARDIMSGWNLGGQGGESDQ